MAVSEELARIKAEKEALELELLREQVSAIKNKQAKKQATHADVESALSQSAQIQKQQQSACTHRKGGVDLPGLSQGFDAKYSVFKHVLPNGDLFVICSRCGKEWRPGADGYVEAINFPTDNTTSQSSQFRIGR